MFYFRLLKSVISSKISLELQRRLLSAAATTIFILSQKTIHKWQILAQRLTCFNVSVILLRNNTKWIQDLFWVFKSVNLRVILLYAPKIIATQFRYY